MALAKAKKETENKVKVDEAAVVKTSEVSTVNVTPEEGVSVEPEETLPENDTPDSVPEVIINLEPSTPDENDEDDSLPEVTVTEADTVIDKSKKPKKEVRVRMRCDHKCCIGGVRYYLKKGDSYMVPESVKLILNKAGLLSPL